MKDFMLWLARSSIFVVICIASLVLVERVVELPSGHSWGIAAIAVYGFCMYPVGKWTDRLFK